jgi:curved DNA-binding protein CbpA
MAEVNDNGVDLYELLQVNEGAEPETINRVYRLLAQRYHPDNRESGDESRFREITEAYRVLSDPERRAQYDVAHLQRRQDRLRLVSAGAQTENDFELEQAFRLTLLEALYTKRRLEPHAPGIFTMELEDLIGRPREHLEFTVWFLMQKGYISRDDNSRIQLTVEGAEFLEQNYRVRQHQRRLRSSNQPDERGDGTNFQL